MYGNRGYSGYDSFEPKRGISTERLCIGILFVLLVAVPLLIGKGCGVGGWGPTVVHHDATVQRTWVDTSKDGSHYMVSTDKGVFEVDNGFMLGMWDADVVYGQMVVGKKYNITTSGKRWTNFLFQYYPYVTKVEPCIEPPAKLNIERE